MANNGSVIISQWPPVAAADEDGGESLSKTVSDGQPDGTAATDAESSDLDGREGLSSLREGSWDNIPQLSFVCGKNGCGKTRLLEEIYKSRNESILRSADGLVHFGIMRNVDKTVVARALINGKPPSAVAEKRVYDFCLQSRDEWSNNDVARVVDGNPRKIEQNWRHMKNLTRS